MKIFFYFAIYKNKSILIVLRNSIIEEILNGRQEPLQEIYCNHRDEFLNWAIFHYSCSEEEAKDVFQDSIVAFYENIVGGKLRHLTCDVKTYIFGVGKFKLLTLLKKNGRTITLNEEILINDLDNSLEKNHESDHVLQILRENIKKLPVKDQEILRMYYFENHDMKTIAAQLGYKNSDVAKKRKYEVFKKISLLIKNSKEAVY